MSKTMTIFYRSGKPAITLIGLFTAFILSACDPGTPSGQTGFSAGGAAAPLSQAEFNSLPPEQQYQVASKLYGTLFRGLPVDTFFDMSNGIETLKVSQTNFIEDTRRKLSTDLSLEEVSKYDRAIDGLDEDMSNPDSALARYYFDTDSNLEANQRARQIPLARIKDYPISRDLYANWMAQFLANTVMYSPAEEMESTDMLDVQRMFRFLYSGIKEHSTIRQMVRSNMGSLTRWRVSRTPQNHALEAFENYLGLFEDGGMTEQEKLKFPVIASLPTSIENAGIACRDLFLTRASDDYLIGQTDFPNTSPKLILEESFVTTCTDVYDAVAGHSLLIPRAIEVIINYLMPGEALREKRLAVRSAIAQSNPQTYEDIFTGIIFSKEYLLNTQRPKSFEENFFPMLDALKWDVESNVSYLNSYIFYYMTDNSNSNTYLPGMNWQTMALKIGRIPNVPLDALSFANYHKAMRETLLTYAESYKGGVSNAGAGLIFDENDDLLPSVEALTLEDYIDYLFLTALHRKANATEQAALVDYVVIDKNYTNTKTELGVDTEVIKSYNYDELAEVVFDYISRLPEFYYFTSVAQ